MAILNKYYLFLITILFVSCDTGNSLNREDYISWIENTNNHLTKVVIDGGVKYTVTYCPKDYMIAKEFKGTVSDEVYSRRINDLEGFEYFKLRISREDNKGEVLLYGLGSQTEYNNRVDYLSYGFEENLILVKNNNKDTLLPALFHFERTYGVVNYLDFLISFREDTAYANDKIQFVIDDVVFGNGIIAYDFNRKDLIDSPKFKIN